MTTNKNAPITGTVNQGAEKHGKANYITTVPDSHHSYRRLQTILASMPLGFVYGDNKPGGALLKCLMVHMLHAPDNRACRAATIKTLARKTGFTPSGVRAALDWMVRARIVCQLATADASVALMLMDGSGSDDY